MRAEDLILLDWSCGRTRLLFGHGDRAERYGRGDVAVEGRLVE
jgi:hypothetical protein